MLFSQLQVLADSSPMAYTYACSDICSASLRSAWGGYQALERGRRASVHSAAALAKLPELSAKVQTALETFWSVYAAANLQRTVEEMVEYVVSYVGGGKTDKQIEEIAKIVKVTPAFIRQKEDAAKLKRIEAANALSRGFLTAVMDAEWEGDADTDVSFSASIVLNAFLKRRDFVLSFNKLDNHLGELTLLVRDIETLEGIVERETAKQQAEPSDSVKELDDRLANGADLSQGAASSA